MEEMQKKTISSIVACALACLLIAAPFLSVALTGILLPPQYEDTYYGQLSVMVEKLKATKGKKVVVVGNSAVAFGVDSALLERLLNEGGLEYKAVNFGLYGAIGTRMMLDLSEEFIGEGDIVIFAPELIEQSLSEYFSAEHAWYALDGEPSLLGLLDRSLQRELRANYLAHASRKFKQSRSGATAQGSGVYAKSSFDERGDLKNYDRPNNVLQGGVDANSRIVLDGTMYESTFVEYVNSYAKLVQSRGASVYYAFTPIMADSVVIEDENAAERFYDHVDEAFAFPILNDLSECILESGWFYDSAVHLNSAGMTMHTINLVNDLKNALGNTTKTDCAIPEMPLLPQPELEGEGNNEHAGMFSYRQDGNYYTITGLTEAGKREKALVLPYQVDGLYVNAISESAFRDNRVVESITVQANIKTLPDGCFSGCDNLERLVLKHESPTDVAVGYYLLDGAEACRIYVAQSALSAFKNNYFWGRYAKRMQAE